MRIFNIIFVRKKLTFSREECIIIHTGGVYPFVTRKRKEKRQMKNRRQARENAFGIIFESKFHKDKSIEEILATAKETRAIEDDDYLSAVVFGVSAHSEEIGALIEKYSHGWKKKRLSPVLLSIMELAVYEMLYCEDIPAAVSINEALELTKLYDEESARAFANGVLNAVAKEIEGENA